MPALFGPWGAGVSVCTEMMVWPFVCPGAVTTTVLALVITDAGPLFALSGFGVGWTCFTTDELDAFPPGFGFESEPDPDPESEPW